jgi:hypothetical protein
VLGWNEFQVQGVRLVFQVLEAAGGGGRSDGKGFGFVVGLPAHDQRPEDPRQFMRPDHDPLSFAQRPLNRRTYSPIRPAILTRFAHPSARNFANASSSRFGDTGTAVPSSCAKTDTLNSSINQRKASRAAHASAVGGGLAVN